MDNRISAYRVMWLLVLFDLPTETKKNIRAYNVFRKNLLKDGFTMFQFSIYVRHCACIVNAFLPPYGKVCVITLTDKQFGCIDLYFGLEIQKIKTPGQQLELF